MGQKRVENVVNGKRNLKSYRKESWKNKPNNKMKYGVSIRLRISAYKISDYEISDYEIS